MVRLSDRSGGPALGSWDALAPPRAGDQLLRCRSATRTCSGVLLVQRLGADTGPPGDLRPRAPGLTEPANLTVLAEVGHLAEGADPGEGEFGVVLEAERPVGVAGCYRLDLVISGFHPNGRRPAG